MIDFHSHILPCMDDGSQSTDESKQLLRMLDAQGVTKAVATAHFYADHESVDSFLCRRQASYDALLAACKCEKPSLILGAEVSYYPGISSMAQLNKLCIEGSKLLLLEMPMAHWTEYTLRELSDLSCMPNLTIVLAHVERYLRLQPREVWARLHESGLLMQANASFFLEFRTRRTALSLLRENFIHFLGSDCHDLAHRPPKIGPAMAYIRKNMGVDYTDQMIAYANTMFE